MNRRKILAVALSLCLVCVNTVAVLSDGLSELAIQAVVCSTEERLRQPSRDGLRVYGLRQKVLRLWRNVAKFVSRRARSPDDERSCFEIGLACFNARDQGSASHRLPSFG